MVADALSRRIIFVLSLKHCIWRFASDRALLAQLRVMFMLKQMMIDSQKDDVKLQERVQSIGLGYSTEFYYNLPSINRWRI